MTDWLPHGLLHITIKMTSLFQMGELWDMTVWLLLPTYR
jgi:hypothetical protein